MRALEKIGGWVSCLTLVFVLALPALEAQAGLAGYPGSFFFGDAQDCDGFIVGTDVTAAQGTMIGLAIDYSGCRPQSSHVQDVDGDGIIQANDVTVLKSWVIGFYGNPTSNGVPFDITLLTPETLPVLSAGDTAPISAWTFDNPAFGPITPRTGWGMIFEIDPLSSCPNGELDGRDPVPEITDPRDKYITSNSVFEYTSEMDALPQGGAAGVLARYTGGCANGTTIEVIVRIPDDNEAITPGQGNLGRFRNPEVPLSPVQSAVNIKIPVEGGLEVTSISINQPDPVDLTEGDTVRITATCTYDDFSTDDCSNAGGIECGVSGSISEPSECLIQANEDPCGAEPPDGTVTVWPVVDPGMTDSIAVDVENDDVMISALITPDPVPALYEGSSQQFTFIRTWTDACTEDLTASAGWTVSGACPGSYIDPAGLYTAGDDLDWNGGGPYCTESVFTTSPVADNSPLVFEVDDDESMPCCCEEINLDQSDPADILEGQSLAFTATCTFSDLSTYDCTAAAKWSCSGDVTCYGSVVTANQIPCEAGSSGEVRADMIKCLLQRYDAHSINVINDDVPVSAIITPGGAQLAESDTVQFSLTGTLSDSCTLDLTAAAGWQITGSCYNSGIGYDTGLFTANDYPGPEHPACADLVSAGLIAADNAPVPVEVIDDDSTRVWFVDIEAAGLGTGKSWADAFNHPQEGVDRAGAIDIVWVADGVYLTPGSTATDPVLVMKSAVKIYGGFTGVETSLSQRGDPAAFPAVLDGLSTGYHVVVGASNGLLDGFIIKNGNAGGGGSRGAGMTNSGLANLRVANCIFENNYAWEGAGMYVWYSDLTVENCDFVNNQAMNYAGMSIWSSTVKIIGCSFIGNMAYDDGGGGMSFFSDIVIEDCLFLGNEAQSGGGFFIHGSEPKSVINTIFDSNLAYMRGGGLVLSAGAAQVKNSLFVNNYTDGMGGGLFFMTGSHTVSNCTFSSNTAGQDGGAVHSMGSSVHALKNSVLWGNSAGDEGPEIYNPGGTMDVTFTDVMGGWTGEGNVNADPLFVTGPLGDFYLSHTAAGQSVDSPCINAGDTTSVGSGLDDMTTSTDGMADSGTVDLGFHYEP